MYSVFLSVAPRSSRFSDPNGLQTHNSLFLDRCVALILKAFHRSARMLPNNNVLICAVIVLNNQKDIPIFTTIEVG